MMDPAFLSKEIQHLLLDHKAAPATAATPSKASPSPMKPRTEREKEKEVLKLDLSQVALSVPLKSHYSIPGKIADPQNPRQLNGPALVKNVASFIFETNLAAEEKAKQEREKPQPWPAQGLHSLYPQFADGPYSTSGATAGSLCGNGTESAGGTTSSSSATALLFGSVESTPKPVSFSTNVTTINAPANAPAPANVNANTGGSNLADRLPVSGLAHTMSILSKTSNLVASMTVDLASFESIPEFKAFQGRLAFYGMEFDIRQIRDLNANDFDAATVHRVVAESDYSLNNNNSHASFMTNQPPRLRVVLSTSTGRGKIPKTAAERKREQEIEKEKTRVANAFGNPMGGPATEEDIPSGPALFSRRRSLSPQRLREMMQKEFEEDEDEEASGKLTFLQANTKDDLFPPEVGVDTLYIVVVRASEAEDYVLNYVHRGYVVVSLPDKDRDGTVGAARQYALFIARMLRASWAFMLDDHLAPIDALCALNDPLLNPKHVPQAPKLLPFPLLTGIKLLEDIQTELCKLPLASKDATHGPGSAVKSSTTPVAASASTPAKSKSSLGVGGVKSPIVRGTLKSTFRSPAKSPAAKPSTATAPLNVAPTPCVPSHVVANYVGVIGLSKYEREDDKDFQKKPHSHSHTHTVHTVAQGSSVSFAPVKGVLYLHMDALYRQGVFYRRDMKFLEDLYFAQQCLLHNLAPISLNFLCHQVTTASHTMEQFETFLKARGAEHRRARPSGPSGRRPSSASLSGSVAGSLSACNSVGNLSLHSHSTHTSTSQRHGSSSGGISVKSQKKVRMNSAVLSQIANSHSGSLEPTMSCSTFSLDEHGK